MIFPHIFNDMFIDNRAVDVMRGSFAVVDEEASYRGTEMDMDIIFGVSAEGMDTEEDTWEVMFMFFGILADVNHEMGSDFRDLIEEGAIGSKEGPILIRHGEGDVLIEDVREGI